MTHRTSKPDKARVLELAGAGCDAIQIAERLGLGRDRVRHIIKRAEERGELVPGPKILRRKTSRTPL